MAKQNLFKCIEWKHETQIMQQSWTINHQEQFSTVLQDKIPLLLVASVEEICVFSLKKKKDKILQDNVLKCELDSVWVNSFLLI